MQCLDNLIFLDVETTGLDKENDEIIEIGAVKVVNGEEDSVFHRLVNPERQNISPSVFVLCQGLSEDKLRAAPRFGQIKDELLSFIGGMPVVCHNAVFDRSFLENSLGCKLENTFLDSLELFCLFKPELESHKMDSIMKHYAMDQCAEHRALTDARVCLNLVKALFDELRDDNDLLFNALEIMTGSEWGWLPHLQKINPVLRVVHEPKPSRTEKSVAKIPFTLDDAEKVLNKTELWEGQFPRYRQREHQLVMARKMADAFDNDQFLFVEAPTGSGKTLAYLLVSLLWVSHNSEDKIFISTNTKNLQDQLHRDLPKVAAVLGMADSVSFADMKGITNYACLSKINEEMKSGPVGNLKERLARLYLLNWSQRSSGELEELSYWMKHNYPSLGGLSYRVSCSKEDCLGEDCKHKDSCFYLNKLAAMEDSNICTINHSLLLTWPWGYPEIKRLVIDEAHNIEKSAFDKFSNKVTLMDIKLFLEKLSWGKGKGYLNNLKNYCKKYLKPPDLGPAFAVYKSIEDQLSQVSVELKRLSRSERVDLNYGFDSKISLDIGWSSLKRSVLNCSETLFSLANALDVVLKQIADNDESFLDSVLYIQGSRYIGICNNWAEILCDCFEQEKNDCCYHVKHNDKGGKVEWEFIVTPLQVSKLFYEKVTENADSIILTSATLAENKTYDRIKISLGFGHLGNRVQCIGPLKQIFDYKNNCVLAVPTDSPGYRKENEFTTFMADAICKVALLLGGKTLVLFTSLRRRDEVCKKVEADLSKAGIRILSGSSRGMVEQFKEGSAVLFGSRGFSEGIDIKGPALSCVIIDKLSFPYQHEPVRKARYNLAENGFRDIYLSEVILTLRQQFGRLIRHESDKGFVVVMDQLNVGKGYCANIIANLPEAEYIQDTLDGLIKHMLNQYILWGMLDF